MRNKRQTLILLVWLAVLTPLLTGCVYWRLNQFRNQLSSFPQHYQIEERDWPTLVALNPVLKQGDLGWLMGLEPTAANAGRLRYDFVKQYFEGESDFEEGAFDLVVRALFKDDRMVAFQFPKRFAPVLTEENFDEVFRPMMDGSLDRLGQATGWSWEDHVVHIPRLTNVVHYFGAPSEFVQEEDELAAIYAYRLKGDNEERNPTGWDIHIRFTFEPEELRVVHTICHIGRLRILVDLRAEKNVVELKRL